METVRRGQRKQEEREHQALEDFRRSHQAKAEETGGDRATFGEPAAGSDAWATCSARPPGARPALAGPSDARSPDAGTQAG